MSKPEAPQPPNPYATAAAQTGTNVSTAVANSYLNNVNQVTPQGTLTYSDTGSHEWTDPSTGHTYNIPTRTSTQTYGIDPQRYLQENPDVAAAGVDPTWHWQNYGQYEGRGATGEAGIYSANQDTRTNLANMGAQQSARVGDLLSSPFNPLADAPQGGDAANILNAPQARLGYDAGGNIQRDFGFDARSYLSANPDVAAAAQASGMPLAEYARLHYDTHGMAENRQGSSSIGEIQGADDFSADRQRVEDSLMARMNPQLNRERSNIEQRLADQGIRYGSEAYKAAMDDYNRQATDTRFGAVSQAGQEQARMVGMSQAVQQQQYDQALGRGSFSNAAQAQQNAQNAGAAGFYNTGAAQQMAQQQSGFNAQNAQRNQYMQEAYQQRNQPLNEISALMSGSQVQNPNWLNSPQSQIPTTDIGGLINQNFAQQQGNYQTAMQSWNSTMGGLLGLGAGALRNPAITAPSDERVKENIVPMGSVFAAGEDGERKKLPISEWSYKGDPERHVGPMAQDVEKIDKRAVTERKGVKHIYPAKVMGSILRAA